MTTDDRAKIGAHLILCGTSNDIPLGTLQHVLSSFRFLYQIKSCYVIFFLNSISWIFKTTFIFTLNLSTSWSYAGIFDNPYMFTRYLCTKWFCFLDVKIMKLYRMVKGALQWRHNGHDGVSNHQPHDCLLNRCFRRISNSTSMNGEFPAQRASNAEMFPFDDVIMDYQFYVNRRYEKTLKQTGRCLLQKYPETINVSCADNHTFLNLVCVKLGQTHLRQQGYNFLLNINTQQFFT